MRSKPTCAAAVLIAVAVSAPAQFAGADAVLRGPAPARQSALDWDTAFANHSGNLPIHFVATYVDARGPHRLEEWRVGGSHLRRLTDARIDLHADSDGNPGAGQPQEYVWQILDLKTRIDHRVTTRGMLRLGMLYSYYSMAHVLSRPAGDVSVKAVVPHEPAAWHGQRAPCFQVYANGEPALRVCWLASLGLPLRIETPSGSSWKPTFVLQTTDTQPIAPETFAVNTKGFQVRNVDEAEAED